MQWALEGGRVLRGVPIMCLAVGFRGRKGSEKGSRRVLEGVPRRDF